MSYLENVILLKNDCEKGEGVDIAKKYGVGGGILAERSGYPVVPIAHNAGIYWRRRGVNKYPGEIQVRIGPVIPVAGKRASEINREVETWIETQQAQLPLERC